MVSFSFFFIFFTFFYHIILMTSIQTNASGVTVISSVLPWNQYYQCNGSNLTAGDRLALRNGGNRGLYGIPIRQLYMLNLLDPTFGVTNIQVDTSVQTDPTKDREMLITQNVLYRQIDSETRLANTYKIFNVNLPLTTNAISIGAGENLTLTFFVKVYDPSTCSVPTLVPSLAEQNVLYDSPTSTLTYPFIQGSGFPAGVTVTSATIQPAWFSTNASIISGNGDSDPAQWNEITLVVRNGNAAATTVSSFVLGIRTVTPYILSSSAPFSSL